MMPALAGKNAYRRAVDSGLLYAEGYTCRPAGIHKTFGMVPRWRDRRGSGVQ